MDNGQVYKDYLTTKVEFVNVVNWERWEKIDT